jgi:ribosomal protein L44E
MVKDRNLEERIQKYCNKCLKTTKQRMISYHGYDKETKTYFARYLCDDCGFVSRYMIKKEGYFNRKT